MSGGIRLNRAMSMLGICSRRDGDKKISCGNVSINGRIVQDMGRRVNANDKVSVDGVIYTLSSISEPSVWIYNKPRGLITSHRDEKGRRSVFDDIKTKIRERVISVGRLDLDSEGLLLITNNLQFARYAETSGWERHYEVRIFGTMTDDKKKSLASGMELEGIRYGPLIVESTQKTESKNSWIKCMVQEGKNREIRKLLGHLGIMISKLVRSRYGPYELGDLPLGSIKKVQIYGDIIFSKLTPCQYFCDK
jgi:23S rRNA pseudouridine2605 synthase